MIKAFFVLHLQKDENNLRSCYGGFCIETAAVKDDGLIISFEFPFQGMPRMKVFSDYQLFNAQIWLYGINSSLRRDALKKLRNVLHLTKPGLHL